MGITMLENCEVKSGGTTVDNIDIEQFEDIPSAVEYFTVKNDEDEIISEGEAGVLNLVNQQHKANSMNAARAAKTRSASPINALRTKAKADPAVRAKLNAFLAELDLGELEV